MRNALATFRCKIALPEKLIRCTSGDSSSLRQRVLDCSSQDGMSTAAFLGGLRDQPTSHVNEVVGDDPEPHPSLHSISPVVAATRQPVPPLEHADPAFTSRAPFLAPLEPALLLPLAPFWAAGATVRDRNVLHAQSMRAFLVGVRVITSIRRHPSRRAPQLAPVRFHCRKQQVPVTGPLLVYIVMRNDLVLRFLQLHQLTELVGLACLSLADNLSVRLKQADQLSRKLGQAVEDSRLGLSHHATHLLGHAFQPFAQLAHPAAAAGRQSLDFLQHAARIVENLPRHPQQLPIFFLALQLPFRPFVAEGLSDGNHPFGHRAHPVAHFLLETARFSFDLFHGPRQHPCAIVQQAAVGGIVDIAFHHRCVHAQLAPLNHTALLRQAHDPVVQFADGLWPNRLPQTKQRLFIRHFRQANPAETPVHHVGAYFPLYNLVTPIAHVLQDQHAQGYFRRRLPPSPRAAPPMPFPLRLVDSCQQFLVLQQLIHHAHPRFPQLGYFLGKQSFPQTRLLVPQLDHWLVLLVL